MKNHNYLEKLTAQQVQKWKEKKGAIFYYEWYDHLINSVDLECAGAVLLAVLYYDRTGGSKPIPAKLMKVIRKNKAACVLLDTFLERTAAASREWINRHKLKNTATREQEEIEEKLSDNLNEEETEDLPF